MHCTIVIGVKEMGSLQFYARDDGGWFRVPLVTLNLDRHGAEELESLVDILSPGSIRRLFTSLKGCDHYHYQLTHVILREVIYSLGANDEDARVRSLFLHVKEKESLARIIAREQEDIRHSRKQQGAAQGFAP